MKAFHSRISCVLKDIEVMHHPPLATHQNVLNLFGYGWNLHEGSIPFLITECAFHGTLREFLRNHALHARQRLKLCRDVTSGLLELHLSGIAHGDLKLDNVLVQLVGDGAGEPVDPNTDTAGEDNGLHGRNVVAKLADFGHSLLLSPEQYHGGDNNQRYRGTTA